MFSVAIWTGLRVGELLVMQWQYLDLEQGAYSVERNFDQRRNLTTPKTKTSNNTIQLSSYVCEILEKHRAEQAAFRLRLPEWVDMDLIFPSRAERKDKAPSKPTPTAPYTAQSQGRRRSPASAQFGLTTCGIRAPHC